MKAFPCNPDMKNPNFDGMDLRDYFASDAMKGFMGSSWQLGSFAEISRKAYELADAMMEARAMKG
jgi:hypothetical protein